MFSLIVGLDKGKEEHASMISSTRCCNQVLFLTNILVHSICNKVQVFGKDPLLNIHENQMQNFMNLYFENYFLAILGRSPIWLHFWTTRLCS